MDHQKKKNYNLYLDKNYNKLKVSRWIHRRWQKVLLAHSNELICKFIC